MTRPERGVAPVQGVSHRFEDAEISLFELASALLIHRRRIVLWAFFGGLLAVVPVLFNGRTWTATASFVPQGVDAGQTGLRGLAVQFGIALPGGAAVTQSPDFYKELITSRVILGAIVSDTIPVAEEGGDRRAVLSLLEIDAPNPAWEREEGIRALGKAVKTKVASNTGVLTVSITTQWPSVSLALVERVLQEVNRFNLQTRQSQAAEERRFVEGRLVAQRSSLVEAEGRLGAFLQRNRQFGNSPVLTFEHDRLQREVALQQQVLVSLAQAYEEARIREVRDVPVITVIEAPSLPVKPDPGGRFKRGVLGLLLGGVVGVLITFVTAISASRREAGDPGAVRFFALLREAGRGLKDRLSLVARGRSR